ncbi:MAG: hypothetical protein ACPLZH_00650 [Minisyncoccales bacterium]
MRDKDFSIFEEFKRSEEKKQKELKIFLFLFLFFFLFSLFFSLLFFRVFDPLWNPFRLKSKIVFSRAVERMNSLSSFKLGGTFTLAGEEENSQNSFSFKVQTNTLYDKREKEKIKSLFDSSLSLNKPNFQIDYFLKGQVLKYDRFFYFNFSEFSDPLSLFFRLFSFDISKWKNQWVKGETKENLLNDFFDFYQEKKFFQIKKEFPDLRFQDRKVYHFLVLVDKEELFNLFSSNFLFKDFLEGARELEFEVFIDKKNFNIYKIFGRKEITISQEKFSRPWKISYSFDFEFSNFNQPFEIFQPSFSKDFSDFYQEFSKIFSSPLFSFFDLFSRK